MFEVVETNAAGILTIIMLWSTLTWVITYWVMSNKVRAKKEVVDFLDMYIEEQDEFTKNQQKEIALLLNEIDKLNGHTCIDNLEATCIACDDYYERIYAEQGGQ
jgi:hypothetical protein